MKAVIKWPGGKTRLLKHLLPHVPKFHRYYEPFLGSGALYFRLEPEIAYVNDLSGELISFYESVKEQDQLLFSILDRAAALFQALVIESDMDPDDGLEVARGAFRTVKDDDRVSGFPLFDFDCYISFLDHRHKGAKRIETSLKSAFYYLVRAQYNESRRQRLDGPYSASLFYLVRELCFGSMFRYNSNGLFNIPYGGFSYDGKDLKGKVDSLRKAGITDFFRNTAFTRSDYRDFMNGIEDNGSFVFLDPPYDSSFSSYTGNEFSKKDHEDLRDLLSGARFKFMMVISSTEFVDGLYGGLGLNTTIVPSTYTYSMRGRNDRRVDYLVMRNY